MTAIQLPNEPQRILIVKPSALGDIVHTLPVLNLLRRGWPNAKVDWLVNRAFVGLIEGHPQLNELLIFERKGFASSWYQPSAAWSLARFVQKLHSRHYDVVIDLQGLLRTGLLTGCSAATVRIGFARAREAAPLFYTHAVVSPADSMHAVDKNLSICEALGCGNRPIAFDFVTEPADEWWAQSIRDQIGRFAVLLPGTNWITKRWPAERFGQLVEPLRSEFGFATVLAGANDAAELASAIPATMNLAGKTSLKRLVALLRHAELVVANDSGPMHIAAALNRPLVAIFGPTDPVLTGPYGRMDCVARVDIPCSPCLSRRCSHISCMKWLEIKHVLAVAREQLQFASTQQPH